jgi:phosphatidylglycerophosphate synthase
MLTAVTGFALWTLALAAYSIRTLVKGRYRVARVDAMGGTRLLGAWPMEFGYWCMNGFARALVALRVGPNAITLASLGTAFAAAGALAFGSFGAGGWLVIAAGLLDVLDGWVARARGVDGEAGEFFDSVVDRYCDLAIYGGLGAYYFRHWPALGAVVWLAMVASFMVTYARVQGEAQGVRGVPNRLMRRHERTAYLGVGLAASPIVASFVEPGVAHPVFHLALVACAIVALVGNVAAIGVASKIHRRLREERRGGRS